MTHSQTLSKKILETIAALRKQKGVSQKDMAARIYVSKDQYRNLEKMRSGTSLDYFIRMTEALEVSPVDIIQACISPENTVELPPPRRWVPTRKMIRKTGYNLLTIRKLNPKPLPIFLNSIFPYLIPCCV